MPKFFADPRDITDDSLFLREDAHHITHVLRMSAGERLLVCDGLGNDYECEILEAADPVFCRILSKGPSEVEPVLSLTLMQGLPKAEKMEWIIQKNTELGVYAFLPLESERSIVKLDGKKKESKEERWSKIALSAAKQSGRGMIPKVEACQTLRDAAKRFSEYDRVIVLYEDEHSRSLKQVLSELSEPKKLALLVGPEGGWSETEIAFLRSCGAVTAGLGKRILRTETAGMTAAAICLYHFDEMN